MTSQNTKKLWHPSEPEEMLHRMTNRIRQSLELQEILDTAVVEVRAFLQTDRVKIYQFYPDGHGEVIAEAIHENRLPSLLGLHFPTDDLPDTAREAFIKARQRVIVDVEQQQICFNDLHDRTTGEMLENKDIRYRPVEPCHVEYLKAMGVTSSLVIPILHQNTLWGLLVAHHATPFEFSEVALQVAQLVADQVSIALAQAILLSQARNQAHREAAINKIVVSLHSLTSINLQQALEDAVEILQGSGGRLYRPNPETNQLLLQTVGAQPTLPPTFQQGMIEQHILWQEYFRPGSDDYPNLTIYPVKDLYAEPRLRVLAPSFAATAIRGLLVVALEYGQQFFGYLTIFRNEVDTETIWAGRYDSDQRQVQPRNSFAAWREQKRQQAVEWTSEDIGLGQALAHQFAIAIYQYELYQRTQAENQHRQAVESTLRRQAEEDRLRVTILQRIRQSLNLETILDTTVAEVRQFLKTDRVLFYRFDADWSGVVVAESVSSRRLSILGQKIHDPCFASQQLYKPYLSGYITQVENIDAMDLPSCHVELLKGLKVKANLAVPIVMSRREDVDIFPSTSADQPILWGLLIAHNCATPRQWQSWEVGFLKQLAVQVAIALQQAELYQQVQLLNVDLEQQVQVRTSELRQALDFESLLKRITDKVRDSLDEDHILQTAVEELGEGLGVECCSAALYDLEQKISTVAYESLRFDMPPTIGSVTNVEQHPALYDCLLQGQHLQFCLMPGSDLALRRVEHEYTIFCCPILDDQEVLGDIWLFKAQQHNFTDIEIRLVQQIANQCAIALRQARLYQAAQAQVEELARLNQLKDDFLSTVSHELRTPMSSIKLATQMLETILRETGLLDVADNKAAQYFQILSNECKREITLINDLLDLTRLDAGSEPLSLNTLDLTMWVPHIAESFVERAARQEQQLHIELPNTVPSLTTDFSFLERILSELLNNACKYTPPEGVITLTLRTVEPTPLSSTLTDEDSVFLSALPNSGPFLLIGVSNTGVEIPEHERDRIFEKFYRIPNGDPWKHGGTGLGLALVKKLAEYIGGSIHLESQVGQTTFTVIIPNLTNPDPDNQND